MRKNCTDIAALTRISQITKFLWPDDPFPYWRPWWSAITTQFWLGKSTKTFDRGLTATVHGGNRGGNQLLTLVVECHLGLTVQTAGLPCRHWGEDQRCWRREVLQARRNRIRGVGRARGTPKLLRRFFTFQDMNICPYPLCQGGKV